MQNSLSSLARVSLWTALLTLLVSGCTTGHHDLQGDDRGRRGWSRSGNRLGGAAAHLEDYP